MNQSFAGTRDYLNKTMISRDSRLDGSVMLSKKSNVKEQKQNMIALRHRIDALKRNVDAVQKKEQQAERERQMLEQGMRNKEVKQLARIQLEEERQRN